MALKQKDIEQLIRRFASTELSREAWTHSAHLLTGLWYVSRYCIDDALSRLREGIRRLNESNGVANTATGGYHETVTRAYVTLLAEFDLARQNQPFLRRAETLLAHPLSAPRALEAWWDWATLMSPAARAGWVPPDRAPLTLAAIEPAAEAGQVAAVPAVAPGPAPAAPAVAALRRVVADASAREAASAQAG